MPFINYNISIPYGNNICVNLIQCYIDKMSSEKYRIIIGNIDIPDKAGFWQERLHDINNMMISLNDNNPSFC